MKKITTLAFAAAAFFSAQANNSIESSNRFSVLSATAPSQDREAEIRKVNAESDVQITAVKMSGASAQDKEARIRAINAERARRIAEINARYNVPTNGGSTGTPGTTNTGTYPDGTTYPTSGKTKYKKNKNGEVKVKSNNGKRLGWEKGVGNPHRNGGSPKGKSKG